MQLHGKVVLITGASEGIGAACAKALRERGARLSLNARSEDKLRSVAGPDDLVAPGDLTLPETPARVAAATLERFGRIDVLINNAGVGLYTASWLAPEPQVRAMFDLNLFAPLAMIRTVVPHMRERRSGTIVNVSSIAGKMTLPWLTLYSASKYALGSLTDGLRMELKRDGIRTMTVCPGYVDTQFQAHILGGRVPAELRRSRRFAITSAECARAIVGGLERDARTVMAPRSGWLIVAAARLLPALVDSQLAKIYARNAVSPAPGSETS
jgi:short-subunit dehydrogenase